MKFFDDYFVFSDSEKKGILIFVIIVLSLSAFYWVMPYVFVQKSQDFSLIEAKIKEMDSSAINKPQEKLSFKFNPNTVSKDSMLLLGLSSKQAYNIINYRNKVKQFKTPQDFKKIYSIPDSLFLELKPLLTFKELPKTKPNKEKIADYKRDTLFTFDPNTVSLQELNKLGLSDKQANTLINFREKGGKFYKKEDLKKIYSISDKTYRKLESYVEIKIVEKVTVEKERELIDINSASPIQFEQTLRVSKKLSYTILNYRNKVGEFYSFDQLKEVYGMQPEAIENNKDFLIIKSEELVKLNINKATFKELVNHPYFSFSDVKKLINYREMHGDFSSVKQILENNLINPKQYRKIAPYLTIDYSH